MKSGVVTLVVPTILDVKLYDPEVPLLGHLCVNQ
jgi:hypothetical protein